MSPPTTEGPTFTEITGYQGPTRWDGRGSSPGPEYAAGVNDQETTAQIFLVAGEPELTVVGSPALKRVSLTKRLVGAEFLLLLEVVGQAQLEGAEVRIDPGAYQTTQDIVLGDLVERFDLAVTITGTKRPPLSTLYAVTMNEWRAKGRQV
jgi:hypothetical protein